HVEENHVPFVIGETHVGAVHVLEREIEIRGAFRLVRRGRRIGLRRFRFETRGMEHQRNDQERECAGGGDSSDPSAFHYLIPYLAGHVPQSRRRYASAAPARTESTSRGRW